MLTWALCDLNGVRRAQIINRNDGTVTIPLSGQRTASVNINIEDDAAAQAISLSRTLKVYDAGTLIFFGPVIVPRWEAATRQLTISAVDPSFRLTKRFLAAQMVKTGIDQSRIMMDLIDAVRPTAGELALGIPDHGIIEGTLPTTKVRTRTYEPGTEIWQAELEMAEIFDGPDFELNPLDRTDGVLAEFNTYAKQGTDRTAAARFEYGLGRNNCSDFAYEPSGEGVMNRFTAVGQAEAAAAAPQKTANHVETQQSIGIYEGYQGSTEITEDAILSALAQEQVAAYATPPDFFTVVPAIEGVDEKLGVPPRVRTDYWIGDTVAAVARLGKLNVNLTGRVRQIMLTEVDKAANVRAEVEIAPTVTRGGITVS